MIQRKKGLLYVLVELLRKVELQNYLVQLGIIVQQSVSLSTLNSDYGFSKVAAEVLNAFDRLRLAEVTLL